MHIYHHLLLSFTHFQMCSDCYSVHKAPLLPLLVTAFRAEARSIPNDSLLGRLFLVANLIISGVKTQAASYTCEGIFSIGSVEGEDSA